MALFDDTFAPYVPFGSRNLSQGSSGTDVAVVQAVYNVMLKTMNPASGPIGSPVTVNGTFDTLTTAAVKAIQTYFGLAVDGVVGPDTFFAFGQGVGANTTYGGPVYGSRQLEPGVSGGDVTILQNRLNCFRYSSVLGGPATGAFNAATAAAVLAFKHDASANGDTGFPDNSIVGFGFYDATWIYTVAGGRAIYTGRNGFDVVFIQVVLKNLGLYTGRITGYYDTPTRSSLQSFQSSHGITADGVIGPTTFYWIGRSNVNAAPVPLSLAWPQPSSAQIRVCCVGLHSATTDLHPYGDAVHAVNEAEGFESLDVTGHVLPSLSGTPYSQYSFTLTDPATGRVVATQPLVPLSEEDWAGTYSPGVKTIPRGRVDVFPNSSCSSGPVVLRGDLANCR